jgi:hypothetical protein
MNTTKFATTASRQRKRETNPFQVDSAAASEGERLSREMMDAASPLAESVVELIIFAYECMYDVNKDIALFQNAVQNTGNAMKQILSLSEQLGKFEPGHRVIKVIEAANSAVTTIPTRGRLDESLLAASQGNFFTKQTSTITRSPHFLQNSQVPCGNWLNHLWSCECSMNPMAYVY